MYFPCIMSFEEVVCVSFIDKCAHWSPCLNLADSLAPIVVRKTHYGGGGRPFNGYALPLDNSERIPADPS